MKAKHYIWSLLILSLIAGCAANDGEFFAEEENNSKTIYMALTLNNPTLKTRQSDQVTQATEQTDGSHFRGIQDLLILPYSVQPTGSDCIDKADQAIGEKVGVDETLADLYHNQPYADKGAPNDKYYLQVPLKIGTNAFLVYGRATEKAGTTDLETKQINGTLTKAGTDGKPASSFTFSPVPMVETIAEGKAASTNGNDLIDYLNSIFDYTWSLESKPSLHGLYGMVQSMKAGSEASVLAFIGKIYELLLPAKETDYVADVLKKILNVESLPTEMPEKLTSLPIDFKGFPGDTGLPDGAAVITWKVTDETHMAYEAVTSKINPEGLNVDVTKFCFPAELYYRANSRIHTSELPLLSAESVFNKAKWAGDASNSVLGQETSSGAVFTPNGIVMPKTTIVAITDPLQYAVGRLDVRLVAKDAANNTLTELTDADRKAVNVNDLKITGVIIGQQSPVDFKFNSTFADAETDPLYMIYDNQVEAYINDNESVTHTLALETSDGQEVTVAVEVQNTSTTNSIMIEGGDLAQIVPPSCKFYLIGKINPAYPAADSETPKGSDNKVINKAIIQDHYTTVIFNITNLAKAYYVVPDLNTTPLELSLGVDKWRLSTPVPVELDY